MENMSEIRQENLKRLSAGFESQRAFSDALDYNPAYINHLLTGYRKIGEKTARKFEDALKKPRYWMDTLHSDGEDYIDSYVIKEINLSLSSQLENNRLGITRIPLINFDRAGSWKEEVRNHIPSNGDPMITGEVGKKVFAVHIPTDSMQPEFDKGEIILVNPDLTPEHEDFIIAVCGGDVVFRQYWREAGKWWLKPLNGRYDMEPLDSNPIIGVVTEKVTRKKYK